MPMIGRSYERTPWDVFDSFNPRDLRCAMHLFGSHNVGNMVRSNLQVGNQAADGEFFVTNWYARTNVLTLPNEFHAWASATIVGLRVNHGHVCEVPLSELFRRDVSKRDLMSDEELATNIHRAVDGKSVWPDISDDERDRWRQIAAAARRHINAMPETIAYIPVHHDVAVQVCTDKGALGALLEVLPTNVAPESLIWVHLEGVRRHVVHR